MSTEIKTRGGQATVMDSTDARPRVLAFEIEIGGHHPSYIQNFAECWVSRQIPARLDFLVTPKFFESHHNVVDRIAEFADFGVRILSLSDVEYREMMRFPRLRYMRAWKLYCQYAKRVKADHGLLMYFDFFQLPSIMGAESPCPFSTIYFRPTFHYHTFAKYVPSIREKLRAKRKEFVLRRVLRNAKLERLYCLDSFAVEYISQHFESQSQISLIADSFAVYESSKQRQSELRVELGIEPGRTVFCLLGVLDQRKGVKELLECLPLVPDEVASQSCLLLAGIVHTSQADEVHSLLEKMQRQTSMQVILRDAFIQGDQVQHYYDLSDVILATYQRHMGSSSALIRAALAQKPVFSSDYGLMGEIVLRRKLGIAVDTGSPMAMANGFKSFIDNDPQSMFDRKEALQYANENSPEQLAEDLSLMVS